MSTEPVRDEDGANEALDLEVVDLDESRDERAVGAGFKSGSGGSSSGCGYWVDDDPDATTD